MCRLNMYRKFCNRHGFLKAANETASKMRTSQVVFFKSAHTLWQQQQWGKWNERKNKHGEHNKNQTELLATKRGEMLAEKKERIGKKMRTNRILCSLLLIRLIAYIFHFFSTLTSHGMALSFTSCTGSHRTFSFHSDSLAAVAEEPWSGNAHVSIVEPFNTLYFL